MSEEGRMPAPVPKIVIIVEIAFAEDWRIITFVPKTVMLAIMDIVDLMRMKITAHKIAQSAETEFAESKRI